MSRHSQIHHAANHLIQLYVDGERAAWGAYRDALPVEIKPFVLSLEQRQRLMIKHNDNRYLAWCTARPKGSV